MSGDSTHTIFLKLGGSLITHKEKDQSPRLDLLDKLCGEIARFCAERPDTRLLLGHGSGSFGHIPAKKFGTREGVSTPPQWRGFAEVWYRAAALNHLVIEALRRHGLPAISHPPSASVTASGGVIAAWDLTPLRSTLKAGLLPVVYGDVTIDNLLGGTILSTEDLFVYLARWLHPDRILIAGLEPGVWADYPACNRLLDEITPADKDQLNTSLQGSKATDVTGGMSGKVLQMLALLENMPQLIIQIFTGEDPALIGDVLRGAPKGTTLRAFKGQIN